MGTPPRSRGRTRFLADRSFIVRQVLLPAQRFIHTAVVSGLVLVVAALIGTIWANSPWADSYNRLIHAKLTIDLGVIVLSESLQHWVNDALMTLFFFVVGLEIKREIVEGELSTRRKAALPVLAALGGMVVPALIYLALNVGTSAQHGWGVPMATDIAFALGVLALLGDRIPGSIRLLLLGLAIVDDIGAILVIAFFYASNISLPSLGVAAVILGVVLVMRTLGFRDFLPYVVVGTLLWLAVFQSGVHATLGGVVLGLMTPTSSLYGRARFAGSVAALMADYEAALQREDLDHADEVLGQFEALCVGTESPVDRLLRILHPWSSFVVLPIFALVNTGVVLSTETLALAATSRVALGVALGLVVGKAIGILGFSFVGVRLGLAELPEGASWKQLVGIGLLAGIGFTVSLFITDLAFEDETTMSLAKIGILAASVIAGVGGFVVLRLATREPHPAAVEG